LHAAAGGVGLAAAEYAHWLRLTVIGSAGAPRKHRLLRSSGVAQLSTSRNAQAGTLGVLGLLAGARAHAVLNSLSSEFISFSSAALGEGGQLEEIGKRSVWSVGRAAAAGVTHKVLDMAKDIGNNPAWFLRCVLEVLARRVKSYMVHSLPVSAFDLVRQAQAAFRFLANGQSVGKVVVRLGTAHVSHELPADFAQLSSRLDDHACREDAKLDAPSLARAYSVLEDLCQQYIYDALCDLPADSVVTWHHKLLFGWCSQQSRRAGERVASSQVLGVYSGVWPEVSLADRCGPQLRAVLQGSASYQELLFPGGSMETVLPVYQDAIASRFYNDAVVAAAESVVEALPPGRLICVVEIGAGTGGTAVSVLPPLELACAQYTFTDVSKVFLRQAELRFVRFVRFMEYELLNIDTDPRLQGFAPMQYDLAIATNVMHATPFIVNTLRNCRLLLRSGGLLLINKLLATGAFAQISFGLTDGWWLFAADPARTGQSSPLMTWQHWRMLLAESGFARSHAVCSDGALQAQAVMVAQVE
jgi:SAM-dependent methyltransferase